MNRDSMPAAAGRNRIVSVSGAPYDGYPAPMMLESLARIGASHVEPAFIVGYTEPFDESAFRPERAVEYARWLADAGIGCHALSSHIDLGRPDALAVFTGRMHFAARIGARVINTNAAARANETRFFQNIAPLARLAEELGLVIGLENPGDGSDNLLNTAADATALLERIGHPRVGLNYDAGNTISHRPGVPAADDALAAMAQCVHTHVKDVRRTAQGWFFTALGEGDIGCDRIVQAIAGTSLSLSIEIPMRLHRGPDAQPSRLAWRVPLTDIEARLSAALKFVDHHLSTVEQTA
ncbi:sugar phosphate isomerase/epimerase [Sphaerotilus hippei]|uniref:Sugar phosphate isomerase/epimerase n=1 Tax=Sphaerotilus hippei TaxID=744406 RepID=A0A318GXS7_9BURK|nr:sugar phosphate isomerase/epimerase family protein [Sphaerotilus hippei]PXW94382.1 sugar phosphate isomerase/epimerase [Sphaerotilus hippei]